MLKYHTEEGKAKIQTRRQEWTPELQQRVSQQWSALMAEVEAVLDQDPAGPQPQALAARWLALIGEFTGGDPEITAGVKRLYADQANWPASFQQHAKSFMNQAVWTYMQKAIAIRQASAT